MSSKSIRNGLNSGAVFSVIIVFLALIGFTVTGAKLVARILGQPPATSESPALIFFVIFMGLLGLWNGALAAKPVSRADKLKDAAAASLTSGGLTGLVLGLLAVIFGAFLAQKIDPRIYLAMVSPETMKIFLFRQAPGTAFVYHLLLMVVSALLGGLLVYGLRKIAFRQRLRGWIQQIGSAIGGQSIVRQLRRAPYTIYILYLLVAIVLFFLPRSWGSYWNYIIGTVGIYVILGLGLNIIVGLAGQLVLGYVAFFAIGAYTIALLSAPKPHNLMWNFWIV